ncbi:MAG: hypothetical protein ACE5GZ_00015 [Gammaproteobacteria bacterium]
MTTTESTTSGDTIETINLQRIDKCMSTRTRPDHGTKPMECAQGDSLAG